jgi:hypothetical protein
MDKTENESQLARAREFSRVDANIPLASRLVPPDENKDLRPRVMGQIDTAEFRSLPDVEDKALNNWMKMLNAKLDAIINMITFQREGFSSLPFTNVNISGGGLSFYSKDWYNVGDILELKMLLPLMPPTALYLYGKVMKVEKPAEGYLIGVKFLDLDEDIQDLIVRFVFQRQRDILREKRK